MIKHFQIAFNQAIQFRILKVKKYRTAISGGGGAKFIIPIDVWNDCAITHRATSRQTGGDAEISRRGNIQTIGTDNSTHLDVKSRTGGYGEYLCLHTLKKKTKIAEQQINNSFFH